jgi:elongator complex protein 2
MILDAAWAPTASDGLRVFATAGRDKAVKIWARRGDGKFSLAGKIAQEHPVTAIDFLAELGHDGALILALGTEGGKLSVVSLKVGEEGIDVAGTLVVEDRLCLPKAVLQLAWRPIERETEGNAVSHELAIAGEDSSLRIYKVKGL